MSVRLIRLTHLNTIPNSTLNERNNRCQRFCFLTPPVLKSKLLSLWLLSKCTAQWWVSSHPVRTKLVYRCPNAGKCWSFWRSQLNSSFYPMKYITQISLKSKMRKPSFSCSITTSNSTLIKLRSMQENETNRVCFLLTLWPQAKVKFTESGLKW